MLSLILPYWDRQAVTDRSIARLNELYELDMEIVVVDDGSPVPYRPSPSRLPLKAVYMPAKDGPLEPGAVLNKGVAESSGDVVCIGNPELWHERPVLGEMLANLEQLGQRGVVMASVWCPEDAAWHVHPSIGGRRICGVQAPEWENSTFLAMMHRAFWDQVGGFDEEYRQGWGYGDHDFVMRLAQHDPKVVVRGDLVVNHSRDGARSAWTYEMLHRNEQLFMSKWA